MIFFDTETTGLVKEGTTDPSQQPRIVELALIRTDRDCRELSRFTTLLNPGIPIPEEVVKVHGITDAAVADAPKFPAVLGRIISEFREDDTLVAHNLRFDLMMLVYELQRIDFQWRFPFPHNHVDTVPLSGGKKLEVWSKEVLGTKFTAQSHRAIDDVERLIACYRSVA